MQAFLKKVEEAKVKQAKEEEWWKAAVAKEEEQQHVEDEEAWQKGEETMQMHIACLQVQRVEWEAQIVAEKEAEVAAWMHSKEVQCQQEGTATVVGETTGEEVAAVVVVEAASTGADAEIMEVGPSGRTYAHLGVPETCTWQDGYTMVDGKVSVDFFILQNFTDLSLICRKIS